jgi:hypothetical protein
MFELLPGSQKGSTQLSHFVDLLENAHPDITNIDLGTHSM